MSAADIAASIKPMSARRGELMKAAMRRIDAEDPKPIKEQPITARFLAQSLPL